MQRPGGIRKCEWFLQLGRKGPVIKQSQGIRSSPSSPRTAHRVHVAQVVRNCTEEAGGDIAESMRDEFSICIYVVFSDRDSESRDVDRHVKQAKEDQRELRRDSFDEDTPVRLFEVWQA